MIVYALFTRRAEMYSDDPDELHGIFTDPYLAVQEGRKLCSREDDDYTVLQYQTDIITSGEYVWSYGVDLNHHNLFDERIGNPNPCFTRGKP